MTMTPLTRPTTPYMVDRFTRADLDEALRRVGIGTGDLVFVQVCADALGPSEAGADPDVLCALIHDALRAAVGPTGTLLVPAYTFSFCKREAFDVEATPTQAGPWNSFAEFPDFVRRLPGAIRSRDPIFSTAGVGPLAAELLTNLPPICLGAGSVHDRVRQRGGKICILGVGLYEAIARHSVEAEQRVPWRYDKLFTGIIREHGEERKEGWLYNVRIRAANADPSGEALERLARENGICRAAPLGRGELLAVESEAFHELARAELARDPWSTVKGPAGNPVALEEA
jgi:aminoglycoside 3-N-acetyltransferase